MCRKLTGDIGWVCRCAVSWCDLDLSFDLAVVTLTFKIIMFRSQINGDVMLLNCIILIFCLYKVVSPAR